MSSLNVVRPIPGVTATSQSAVSTTTQVDRGLPFGATLLLFGLFIVLIIALAVWNFLLHEQLNTRNLQQTQSIYCPSFRCQSGTQPLNVQLDPSDNPNTATYETYNFCSVNAPPTSFVQSLELCGGLITSDQVNVTGSNTISPATSQQVTDFAKFYNEEYVDTCGWSWKNPPPEAPGQTTTQSDPVITAILACAESRGVSSDPNVQALQTKCGSSCNPSNPFVPINPQT